MINNEIRNGILLFLYNKFYDGRFYDQLITDVEVLPQLGIPVESLGVTHKNLAYLEEAGYTQGTTPSGHLYPKWMRIDTLGIDFVETIQTEKSNLHWNIRFRILAILYDDYFSDRINEPKLVNPNLVNELANLQVNKNLIFGDVIYLKEKYFISGYSMFGFHYPVRVKIETAGIQFVESVINNSLLQIADTTTSAEEKKELEQIAKELDKKTKFERFIKLIQENTTLIELVVNVTKTIFIGG